MNVVEYGKCEVCGKEKPLIRTYFHYGFKCQCHSPNHFEFVRHCADCVPQKPLETKVVFSDEQANNLATVKRGKWVQKYPDKSIYYCSECNFPDNQWYVIRSNYCGHCGAKMDGDGK